MQCQECQQRPATLQYTQYINDQKSEIHVCEVCAKEKGYMSDLDTDNHSIHDLLAGLFNFEKTHVGKARHQQAGLTTEPLTCTGCGMTFPYFKRVGKFGCAECYTSFAAQIEPILRRVHSGNITHHGKIPKRKGGSLHHKRQIKEYKDKLQSLIKNEAFEEAAVIRDKIKALEGYQPNESEGDQ